MNILRNIISTAFESYLVRVATVCVVLGAVPFYFLSMALASVQGN